MQLIRTIFCCMILSLSTPLIAQELLGKWTAPEQSAIWEFRGDSTFIRSFTNGPRVDHGHWMWSGAPGAPALDLRFGDNFAGEKMQVNITASKIEFLNSDRTGVLLTLHRLVSNALPTGPDLSKITGRTLQEQAGQFADQYWARQFRKCSDLSYFQAFGTYTAIKGLRSSTRPLPISDVDKLNGVQWRGITTLTADAQREFNPNLKAWQSWIRWPADMSLAVERKNGQWSLVAPSTHAVRIDWSGKDLVDCSRVPRF